MNPSDLRIDECLATPEGHNSYNRRLFSFIAGRYDSLTRGLSIGRDAKWKRSLIAGLPGLERPDCLDLACGTGDLAMLLARRYRDGRVTGIDLTPEMISKAREKCGSPRVQFHVREMCDVGFPDGSFDIVTAGYAFRNASSLSRALCEAHRVMRPGGALGILEFSKPPGRLLQAVERAVLRGWGAACGLFYYGDARSCVSIPTTLKRYPDAPGLETALGEAGFTAIRTRTLLLGVTAIVLCRKRGSSGNAR